MPGWLTALGAGLAGLVAAGVWRRQADLRDDRQASAALSARPAPARFDPAMLDGLPPLARRYLTWAIAPGTVLSPVVCLQMRGRFVLNGKGLPMRARQVLAPPHGLVWRAHIGQGIGAVSGSDGLLALPGQPARSWTRFRALGLVPVARAGGTPDHLRSAATRAVMEAVWCPASLLPQAGAVWRDLDGAQAEVGYPALTGVAPMHLELAEDGAPRTLVAARWSDANPQRRWQLQPFGGRVLAHGSFGGFRIPTHVELGNHWGTPAYAPFFEAEVTAADFTTSPLALATG
jgi:hypothetical protein